MKRPVFIVTCFIINSKNISHCLLEMNKKLKHKELYELRSQKKGEHSNMKSE
jgi:hypothetical protein